MPNQTPNLKTGMKLRRCPADVWRLIVVLASLGCVDPRDEPLSKDGGQPAVEAGVASPDALEDGRSSPADAVHPLPSDAESGPREDAGSASPSVDAACPPPSIPCQGGCLPAGEVCGGCPAGMHVCAGQCVSDQSVESCGSSCAPCAVPANGSATCDGTTCGVSCPSGTHACGASCVSDRDVATCGSRCAPCPTPPNATATCEADGCRVVCSETHLACSGGTCERKSWNFESAQIEGWTLEALNSRASTAPLMVSTERAYQGSHALVGSMTSTGTESTNLSMMTNVCPASTHVDLRGRSFAARVFVDGPSAVTQIQAAIKVWTANGSGFRGGALDLAPGVWTPLSATFDGQDDEVRSIGVYVNIYARPGESWTGKVFVDDVSIR